jgi:hypothetical protein
MENTSFVLSGVSCLGKMWGLHHAEWSDSAETPKIEFVKGETNNGVEDELRA